jgi:hypothetical protein
MDAMYSQRIRSVLVTFGAHDLWRTDDHEVARRFRNLIRDGTRLRSLADIETAIEFLSRDNAAYSRGYGTLFLIAVDILSFRTPKDSGILYSGQYYTLLEHSLRAGTASGDGDVGQLIAQFASSKVRMQDVALVRAREKQKCPIDSTEGGRWLRRFNLPLLVGPQTEQKIWSTASEKYVRNLAGEVEVFLAFPEFKRVFRSVESHALFKNGNVSRIVYFLEHGDSRIADMPPELSGDGVVQHARGKELIFRVAKG